MKATVKVVGMVAGGRQHVVASVQPGDPVLLIPEPDNPHDRHAVAVHTASRRMLLHPTLLVSSITDVDHVGHIHDDDRILLMDRQAGYLPRDVAALLTLPADGIVGYVSAIRHAPDDYTADGDTHPPRTAGFDVTAWLPRTDPWIGESA